MGPEEIYELEGEALALLRAAGEEDEAVPRLLAVASQIGATVAQASGLATEGKLEQIGGSWRILVRRGLSPARARWVVGHEIAEWVHLRSGYRGQNIEARCDALGAMLVAPRSAFRRAIRDIGRHAVHELAARFRTTQSVALLRVGEITGRPVMLLRWPDPIVRGSAFSWPRSSTRRSQPATMRGRPLRPAGVWLAARGARVGSAPSPSVSGVSRLPWAGSSADPRPLVDTDMVRVARPLARC